MQFNNINEKLKGKTLVESTFKKEQTIPIRANKLMMEEEKVEVEGENFIEQDIDENPGQDTTDVNLASINKSFVPRIFEGRKLPQTPGFSHRKLLSVMKKKVLQLENLTNQP